MLVILLVLVEFLVVNSNVGPEVGAFSILVLDFEFVHFDPQLINKLLISSIWHFIRSISSPIFIRLL